jgi:hypothetical protein
MRYRASKLDCDACGLKPRCCPNAPARKILRSIHEGARDMARDIATSDAYARTADSGSDIETQRAALEAAGCAIVRTDERESGLSIDRPGLRQALDELGQGDELVCNVDRLSRNLSDLDTIFREASARGAAIVSLDEGERDFLASLRARPS